MARADADAERRDWTIEGVVPGGDGFLHLDDGRAAFVTGAFPGDVIHPLAVEAKKGHLRATRFSLVMASPARTTPPCRVAEACGGCDWMALAPSEQLVQKAALLRAALARIGGIELAPDAVRVTAVGADLRYRSRVRFHVDRAGRIGFFARGSHELVEIPGCPVCHEDIDAMLTAIRTAPREILAAFSEIEVRRADALPQISITLVPRVMGGAAPSVKAVRKVVPEACVVTVAGEEGGPEGTQTFALPGGVTLRARASVFTQVNWPVNVALVDAVVEGATERRATSFLDAYAGAGNFSLPLLAAGLRGISVEKDRRAVDDARAAAAGQGLESAGFLVGEAERLLPDLAKRHERFDLVLLDPPRSGARDVLRSVMKLAPSTIAICACDPVTLARDVGTLVRSGYGLVSVRGFDMFPHTHHLEALAFLTAPRAEGT